MRLKKNKPKKGARARTIAASRKKARHPFWYGMTARLRRSFRLLVIGAFLIWLLVWAGFAGLYITALEFAGNRFSQAMAGHGFVVETVRVSGRYYTAQSDVAAALSIDPGQPLFDVDLHGVRTRLSELEWVSYAVVRRQWPDRILVTLTERQPMAVWREDADAEPLLLDREGTVIFVPIESQFRSLLRVEGNGAPLALKDLVRLLLSQPELAAMIRKARRVSERRWDLVLTSGTIVKLPEEDIGFALSRLAKLMEERDLIESPASEIDLRLNDRMIIADEE